MLRGFSYEGFEKDEVRQKAVLFDFLCVSEASARIVDLDPSIVNDHPEIPWAQIRGFGNLIRHACGKLDMESVWEAATGEELSELVRCATAQISKTKE